MPESGITLIWPFFSLSFCVCPSIFHRVVKIAIYFVFSVREKIENCQRKCYGDFFHASKYFSLKGIEDKIWKQIKLQNLSKDNKTMFKYSKVIKRLQIFCLSWTDIFFTWNIFSLAFCHKNKGFAIKYQFVNNPFIVFQFLFGFEGNGKKWNRSNSLTIILLSNLILLRVFSTQLRLLFF